MLEGSRTSSIGHCSRSVSAACSAASPHRSAAIAASSPSASPGSGQTSRSFIWGDGRGIPSSPALLPSERGEGSTPPLLSSTGEGVGGEGNLPSPRHAKTLVDVDDRLDIAVRLVEDARVVVKAIEMASDEATRQPRPQGLE